MDTVFLIPTIVKGDTALKSELVLDGDGVREKRHPHIFDPNRKSFV